MTEKDEDREGKAPPGTDAQPGAGSAPGEAKPAPVGAPAAETAAAKPAAPATEARVRPAPKVDPVEQALRAEAPSIPLNRLRSGMPGATLEVSFYAGLPLVLVKRSEIADVCRFLRDDPECD